MRMTRVIHDLCTILTLLQMPDLIWSLSMSMDPLLATQGQPYYIRCTLKIQDDELAGSQAVDIYKRNMIIAQTGGEIKCVIRPDTWIGCNGPFKLPPKDKGCLCYNKKSTKEADAYRFFLYLKRVDERHSTMQFRCEFSNENTPETEIALATQQMNVYVLTTEDQHRVVYGCENTNFKFSWDYAQNCTVQGVRTVPRATKISWFKTSDTSCEKRDVMVELGSYDYYKALWGVSPFSPTRSEKYRRRIAYSPSKCNFMQLQLKGLKGDSGCYMIEVEVDRSSLRVVGQHKRRRRDVTVPPGVTQLINNLTELNTTRSPADLITTSVGTTQAAVTTTEPPQANQIQMSTTLIVSKPPGRKSKLHIEGSFSITGTLIITCSIRHYEEELGVPPVNITILRSGKRDAGCSRAGISRHTLILRSTSNVDNYSCIMEGPAMDCIKYADDPRRKAAVLDTTVIKKSGEYVHSLDVLVVLFGVEMVTCIGLLFWGLSLTLQHVLLIMRHRRDLVELKANVKLILWDYEDKEVRFN
ncbi:uncharacterized protein LOC101850467 [Aplysia californica]|uniref:Uncharacterized protein LOC101850467 n=1 Tax=Aplysia californica TaxID=6500 RepID=A0ABM0ZWH9_APLCA|nr:uncharacterized protein LOC101850467 [Aplysia californica]